MTRVAMALVLLSAAAAAAEPAKFGKEHMMSTVACAVESYRYTGAAELAARRGETKAEIASAVFELKSPGQTDEQRRAAAEQAAEYALSHSRAQAEQLAEEKFAACLKAGNLPVDQENVPNCWRSVRRLDDIIAQREQGVSKETMLERAAVMEATNPAAGRTVHTMVEQVYGWERSFPELSLGQLISCVGSQRGR